MTEDHRTRCHLDPATMEKDLDRIASVIGEKIFKDVVTSAYESTSKRAKRLFVVDANLLDDNNDEVLGICVQGIGNGTMISNMKMFLAQHGKVVCNGCEKIVSARKAMQCSGCKMAYYCSKKCQRFDWKEGHKSTCSLKKR